VADCRPDRRIPPTIAAPPKESFIVSHSPSPLQIATKIHFFLMRELGKGIDVEKMLQQPRYARDVLLVCDACRGTELADLATTTARSGSCTSAWTRRRRFPGTPPTRRTGRATPPASGCLARWKTRSRRPMAPRRCPIRAVGCRACGGAEAGRTCDFPTHATAAFWQRRRFRTPRPAWRLKSDKSFP
jgi:hypothetical protein